MNNRHKIRNYLALGALTLSAVFLAANAKASEYVTVEADSYGWVDAGADEVEVQAAEPQAAIARFGPFHVVAPDRAELLGSIETNSVAQFKAMLRAYPGIKQIDMLDCPGTGDDAANFAIARMIRKGGMTTYVPDGGSVRSGGVELFLAGAKRHAAPTAEFAVHSWRDEDGLEPDDFAESDPINQEYITYYRQIGMSEAKARAFYALTNSVPADDALYLKRHDIAAYIPLD